MGYQRFALLALLALVGSVEGKQRIDEEMVNKFRGKQMNLIYSKIANRLNASQLQQVEGQLSELDGAYLALKHEHKVASDIVAVRRKELDQKLAAVLQGYGVGDVASRLAISDKHLTLQQEPLTVSGQPQTRFSDKKLNKLWQRAEGAGFSEEELQVLKKQFQTQDQEIQAYHELAAEIAHTRSNDVSVVDGEKVSVDEKEALKKMKVKLSDLQLGYRNLSETVETREKDGQRAEFKSANVASLWTLVESSSVTASKKLQLKDELRRLDKKMEKLRFVRGEIADAEVQLGKAGKNHLQSVEYKQLTRQLDDINRKVTKMEGYIRSQIHSEL